VRTSAARGAGEAGTGTAMDLDWMSSWMAWPRWRISLAHASSASRADGSSFGRRRSRHAWRGFGVDTFARESDTVYHSYSSTPRGVEFLMSYYAILDRTPKGRDEGDAFQTWLRRHDEYEGPDHESPVGGSSAASENRLNTANLTRNRSGAASALSPNTISSA
jgi:hypothetical protein